MAYSLQHLLDIMGFAVIFKLDFIVGISIALCDLCTVFIPVHRFGIDTLFTRITFFKRLTAIRVK